MARKTTEKQKAADRERKRKQREKKKNQGKFFCNYFFIPFLAIEKSLNMNFSLTVPLKSVLSFAFFS